MISNQSTYTKRIHVLVDFFLLNLAFFWGYFMKFGDFNLFKDNSYFSFIVYFNVVWLLGANYLGSYTFKPEKGIENVLLVLFKLLVLHIVLLSFFWVYLRGFYFSRLHLFHTYSILFVCMLAWKMSFYYFLKFYRKQWFKFKNVIIVGYGDSAIELSKFFQNYPEYGFRFLGFLSDEEKLNSEIIGKTYDLRSVTENIKIDEIYVSVPDALSVDIDELIDFADDNVIRLRIMPDLRRITNKNYFVELFEGIPILSFRNLPLDDMFNRAAKRGFDLLFSGFVIIFILSWLFPILSILIVITSKGPVFFRQKRTGKDGNNFWCYKFRSMYVNKGSDKVQARKGDARITPIGKLIRKTSLDEFPQFINVFLGNMSIVGPRPHMLKHTEEYSQIISKYMVRHFVKPGITGLAQIKGYRGETTDSQKMQGRIKMDIFYIENWQFLLDIKIISVTVLNIFKGEENAG